MTKLRRMLMTDHKPKVYDEVLRGHVATTLFVAEGICCDDTYFYVSDSNVPSVMRLRKDDFTRFGKYSFTVAQIEHANGIVIDSNGGLWTTQNTSTTGTKGMAHINSSDMSWAGETGRLKDINGNYVATLSPAYNHTNGHFYTTGGVTCYEWDAEWNPVRTFALDTTARPATSTGQGCACDGQYIYTVRSKVGGDSTKNIIRIHDLNGNYIGTINCKGTHEAEDLAYDAVQDRMYIVYYLGTRNDGFDIYELKNFKPN